MFSFLSIFSQRTFDAKRLWRISLLLLVWVIAVEIGVHVWYFWRDSQARPNPLWQVSWPTNAADYATRPFPEATLNLLRFDDGKQAFWSTGDGRSWETFYLHWKPGRMAGYLSKLHTPQVCLPSMGLELRAGPELITLSAGKLALPFQRYQFASEGRRADVFYCRWPDRGKLGGGLVGQSAWGDRVRNVWEGKGNFGQRVLEIVLWDYPDSASATAALRNALPSLIQEISSSNSTAGGPRPDGWQIASLLMIRLPA